MSPVTAFVSAIGGVAAVLLSPFVALSELPNGPIGPQLFFALLDAVRRELQRSFFNQPPVVGYDPLQNSQDAFGAVTGRVTATDADRDPVAFGLAVEPTNGSVVVRTDGTFTYTPSPGVAETGGTDTFTLVAANPYHLHLQDGATGLFTPPNTAFEVAVTIRTGSMANRAPVATAAPTAGRPSADGVINGALNVVDPDGDALSYDVTTRPSYGSVAVNTTTGVYTYTPRPGSRLQAALSTDTVETDSFTITVSDSRGGRVDVPLSGVLVTELPTNSVVASVTVGDGPTAAVTSPDGSITYVANTNGDSVSVIDAATNTTITTVTVGDAPVAIAVNPAGTVVYTANGAGRSVTLMDAATNTVMGTVAINAEPTGIAVSPNGLLVYTTNTNSTVTVINAATRVISTIQVDPAAIVFTSNGSRAYLLDSVNQLVNVLDTDQGTVVTTVEVGNNPSGIAISPDDAFLYVTNTDDDTVTVIVTADDTVLRTVNVGDQPHGIAVTPSGGRIYVANFGDDSISVIDANTFEVTSVPVSNGPFDIEINAAGTRATITHVDDDVITVLLLAGNEAPVVTTYVGDPNPGTGTVTGSVYATDADGDPVSYIVTTAPVSGTVMVDGDGTFTFTPDEAARQTAASTSGIDTDTFIITVDDNHGAQVLATVTVEIAPANGAPAAVAAPTVGDPDQFGVVTGNLNVVDPEGNSLTYTVTKPPIGGTITIDTNGRYTYTPTLAGRVLFTESAGMDSDSFTIAVRDSFHDAISVTVADVPVAELTPNTVVAVIPVIANYPRSFVVSADGTRIYLAGSYNTISVIDTITGAVIGNPIDAGYEQDLALSPDGTRLYVTAYSGNTVTVVDTSTGRPIGQPIPVGRNPLEIAISPDGRYLYTANGDGESVTVLDTTTNARTDIPMGDVPRGVVVSPDGRLVYVTRILTDSVSVIDTATNTVVGDPIAVGDGPFLIAISPDGATVYVTNLDGNSVSKIDTATNTATTIPVGGRPYGIVVSPDGASVYVANLDDNTITVIDTATDTTTTIAVGASIYDLAVTRDGRFLYVANPSDQTVSVIYVGATQV